MNISSTFEVFDAVKKAMNETLVELCKRNDITIEGDIQDTENILEQMSKHDVFVKTIDLDKEEEQLIKFATVLFRKVEVIGVFQTEVTEDDDHLTVKTGILSEEAVGKANNVDGGLFQ